MEERVTGGKRGPDRLFVLSSPEELARAAAGRLWGTVRERCSALERAGNEETNVRVALSGGGTPRRALEILASDPYGASFPWDRVHFCQVDERWVPPGDPLSNRRMVNEALISRAPVPASNFHFVDTSLPGPSVGARMYEKALRNLFRVPGHGLPRFDAILLGIGKDGHTASLFPDTPDEAARGAWVVTAAGGDPPVPRVTLTLPVLCAAARVIFVVSGSEKAEALSRVLSGDPHLPASRVVATRGTVTFLADSRAASMADAGERATR
jgi:6-phosphogluconolactonase